MMFLRRPAEGLVILVAFGLAAAAGAQCVPPPTPVPGNVTWSNAAGGVWSDPCNWSPLGTIPGAGYTAAFGAVGSGATNTMDFAAFAIGRLDVQSDTHTTDLGPRTLTASNVTVVSVAPTALIGSLTVAGTTDSALNATTTLTVAQGRDATASLIMGSDVALRIGTNAASRAAVLIANNTGASPSASTGAVVAGRIFSAYLSSLRAGFRSGFSATITNGTLDLAAVTESGVLDVAGDLWIGEGRMSSGDVIVSNAVDVKIGVNTTTRGSLRVSTGGHNASTPASSLALGTGRLDAYLTVLMVSSGSATVGTLAAGQSSGGVLDVSGDVLIGEIFNLNGAADGSVTVSDNIDIRFGSPTSRSSLMIGRGKFAQGDLTAGAGAFEAYLNAITVGEGFGFGATVGMLDLAGVSGGILDVAGDVTIGIERMTNAFVTLGNGFTTKIGDAATPVKMNIGTGDRPEETGLTADGTFTAFLTDLTIGRNYPGNNGAGTLATLDLAAVSGGAIEVSGTMLIADGLETVGEVYLPALPAVVTALVMGQGTVKGKGLLDLNGTDFAVTNAVTLDGQSAATRSVVRTHVNDTSSGLDLLVGATLSVGEALIDIIFEQNAAPGVIHHYGLRCVGDRVAELSALATAGKLTWDDSAIAATVGIYYDAGTDASYVGYLNATNQPPVAACQDITVQLGATLTATITAADVDDGSSDPDGDALELGVAPDTFTCDDLGDNTVTLTVDDGNGGTDTCTATVTVATSGTCDGMRQSVLEALCDPPSAMSSLRDATSVADDAIEAYLAGVVMCDDAAAACRLTILQELGLLP